MFAPYSALFSLCLRDCLDGVRRRHWQVMTASHSAFPIGETVEHLKKDIADKGIKFFDEIDQVRAGSGSGISLRPSVLLIFGNPPLGTQFITAKADAFFRLAGAASRVPENKKARCGLLIPILTGSARRHGNRPCLARWHRHQLYHVERQTKVAIEWTSVSGCHGRF